MTDLRLGILAGDEVLTRRAASVAPAISKHAGTTASVVTISGPELTEPETFSDAGAVVGDRRRTQLEALSVGAVDLLLTRARDWMITEDGSLEGCVVLPRSEVTTATLVATPELAEPSWADPLGLPPGSRVGVTTKATACQLLARRPDLEIVFRTDFSALQKTRDSGPGLDAIVVVGEMLADVEDGCERFSLSHEALLPSGADETFVVAGCSATALAALQPLSDADSARCLEAEGLLTAMLDPDLCEATACLSTVADDGVLRLVAVVGYISDNGATAEISRVGSCAPDAGTVATACFHALNGVRPGVER